MSPDLMGRSDDAYYSSLWVGKWRLLRRDPTDVRGVSLRSLIALPADACELQGALVLEGGNGRPSRAALTRLTVFATRAWADTVLAALCR